MEISFVDEPASGTLPVLISGNASSGYPTVAFIVLHSNSVRTTYEIRSAVQTDIFREVMVSGNILAVGFGASFYLFDTKIEKPLLVLEMDGYFGHLLLNENEWYVTDAAGVYCITLKGKLKWQSGALAVDGLIIDDFTEDKLYISAEMDPPDGWVPLILDRKTGQRIS